MSRYTMSNTAPSSNAELTAKVSKASYPASKQPYPPIVRTRTANPTDTDMHTVHNPAATTKPSRAKLRQSSTAPPTSFKTYASSSSSTHQCRQCRQQDNRFFCHPCLNSRIKVHHTEIARLTLAALKAKHTAQLLLGTSEPKTSSYDSQLSPLTGDSIAIQEEQEQEQDRHDLPDPFQDPARDPQSSDTSLKSLKILDLIQARARKAAIIARTQDVHRSISESQETYLRGKENIKEKRAQLLARKQNLAKAWSSLEGASPPSSSSIQRSRSSTRARWLPQSNSPASGNPDSRETPDWSTDVYTHYEKRADESSSSALPVQSDELQLGFTIARTRSQVATLEQESKRIASELKKVRARLARQAFSLFSVSVPNASSSSSVPANRVRREDMSTSSFMAHKISQLSGRYMPGAFNFTFDTEAASPRRKYSSHADRPDSATSVSSAPSDWTIVGLALPLPSEVRRHPRETINGAITYTANLLHILANYLGIALPFPFDVQQGRLTIKPDPLWDGGGGSSSKPLHLSSAAYTVLTSVSASSSKPSKLNNLAESTFGLGASTLSTIESYIQLPSSSSLSWGLTSAVGGTNKATDSTSHRDGEATLQEQQKPETESNSSASKTKVKPDQAAKAFVSALVMLSYNTAYLASKQGIKIDLVTAAANPLQLLHKIVDQVDLGAVAHTNHIRASSIDELSMPQLDYEQLAQILEPMNTILDASKKSAAKSGRTPSRSGHSRPSRSNKILEQSYVDAGEAAASVLNIQDPSKMVRAVPEGSKGDSSAKARAEKPVEAEARTSSRVARAPYTTGSSDAKGRQTKPNLPAPTSLDFLRQRGRDVTKPKDATTGLQSKERSSAKHNDADSGRSQKEEPISGAVSEADKSTSRASAQKVGAGAVIFNGVEVGIGNPNSSEVEKAVSGRNSRGQNRRSAANTARTEDGWDLV